MDNIKQYNTQAQVAYRNQAAANQTVQEINQQIEKSKQEQQTCTAKLEAACEERRRVEQTLKDVKNTLSSLRTEVETNTLRLAAQKRELENMEATLKGKKESIQQAETKKEELETRIAKRMVVETQYNDSVKKLHQEESRIKLDLEKMDVVVQLRNKELSEVKSQISDLRETQRHLDDEVNQKNEHPQGASRDDHPIPARIGSAAEEK